MISSTPTLEIFSGAEKWSGEKRTDNENDVRESLHDPELAAGSATVDRN